MLTKKQIKFMKVVGILFFVLAFFTAMLASFSIINILGNYEKGFGVILLTAMGITLIFIVEYRLLRKPLLFMINKIEEKVSAMKIVKWIEPTDKKRTPEEILLDAVLDVGAGFEEPVPCEKIWKVVSEWYNVDWMCLTGIYKKARLKKERRICMYLMHQCGKIGFDEIAQEMGVKNGAKVIREINELDTIMRKNKKLRDEVLEIVGSLR